ncbi:tetratricopeptide repeat protein [Teichococcus oryzae]|uniref:Adenylate/guanylate cyclase domain-containing protein n=1 Tax=Teichococcus oryzae TaxID=1608942 RepID=A0A5B2TCW5_9PROT|nr:tetratricopeptide repeat protein [Pseudoroseomonas oryzae]KAA2212356.1 adenylate/guanylate cyclase domain-containing protein [Pseudoroseomonas oryzae]
MGAPGLVQVTLLFTDIEGSTRLLRSVGDEAYGQLLDALGSLFRSIYAAHHGRVIDTQGDSCFAVFRNDPLDAMAAAARCQHALAGQAWPGGCEVRVRAGIHVGHFRRGPRSPDETYVGLDVHRAARLCEAGHGGQILVSDKVAQAVEGRLPPGFGLKPLGEFQLRDLSGTDRLFQLLAEGLATEFPPLRALDVRRFNLPLERSSLLGRETQLAELHDLLLRPENGLVSLVGPAGVGKTRLAIAVARKESGAFRDGVCFVALAAVSDAELVASTIVRALGLQESGGMPLEEVLIGYLRDRGLMLVLDNFEHLLDAAPLVAGLLASCSQLKILVTSRAALRLRGEHEYPVPPLSFPPAFPPAEGLPDHAAFHRYPALALFAERAEATASRFAITAGNFSAVVAICARLDGLPLAIELAAARANILSPGEMLAHLSRDERHGSLDLLTGGTRDAPERHRTLRGAIGWSYGLLHAEDQALFRLLSVFVGSFTVEAAAAIAAMMPAERSPGAQTDPGAHPGGLSRFAFLDALGWLVESNLLQCIEAPGAQKRFQMLETIREFGLEQLEAQGELDRALHCHAIHFLRIAEQGEKEAGGPRQSEWLGRLDEEHGNFRGALARLFGEGGDAPTGIRMACALWVFWFRRAYLREGSRWIQMACALCPPDVPPLRARLLTCDGSLARMLGDFPRAEKLLEEAATLWRVLGDREGLAWALSHLGLVKQWLGELDSGVELLEESLSLRLSSGDRRGIARSLFNLAVAEDFRCHYARAAELYRRTLDAQQELGDVWGTGRALGYLAKVALREGDHARARALCQQAMALSRQVADKWGVGLAQAGLGGVALAEGQHAAAAAMFSQSLLTFRDVGSRDRIAECLQDLSSLLRQAGRVEQAVQLSAAAVAAQQGGTLALWPAVRAEQEAEMRDALSILGPERFQKAWAEGGAMGVDEAVAMARELGHLL